MFCLQLHGLDMADNIYSDWRLTISTCDQIYSNWRQRIMAGSVALMAEHPR